MNVISEKQSSKSKSSKKRSHQSFREENPDVSMSFGSESNKENLNQQCNKKKKLEDLQEPVVQDDSNVEDIL